MTKFWFTLAALVGVLFFFSSCSTQTSKTKKAALERAPQIDSPHKGIAGGHEYLSRRIERY